MGSKQYDRVFEFILAMDFSFSKPLRGVKKKTRNVSNRCPLFSSGNEKTLPVCILLQLGQKNLGVSIMASSGTKNLLQIASDNRKMVVEIPDICLLNSVSEQLARM